MKHYMEYWVKTLGLVSGLTLRRSGGSPGIIFNKNLDNCDAGVLSPYSESSILALAAQI